jgi:hypothetical protein
MKHDENTSNALTSNTEGVITAGQLSTQSAYWGPTVEVVEVLELVGEPWR